jgi:hypothetical protein
VLSCRWRPCHLAVVVVSRFDRLSHSLRTWTIEKKYTGLSCSRACCSTVSRSLHFLCVWEANFPHLYSPLLPHQAHTLPQVSYSARELEDSPTRTLAPTLTMSESRSHVIPCVAHPTSTTSCPPGSPCSTSPRYQVLKSDLSALSDSIGHGLRQWTLSYIANRLDYLVVMIILNTYLLLSYCDTMLL